MKRFSILVGLLALAVAFAGCKKETEQGGPGAPATEADSAKTFTLKLPDGASMKAGETEEAIISLNPGSEFHEEVVVTLVAPAGVTVDPAEFKLSKDAAEGKVMISGVSAGDHTIAVTGKPATGTAVNSDFKVHVDKSDAADATPPPSNP